ncbi:MAG TPA: hypothetical protein VD903_11190 [Pseudonocardia sp.]|nr:hypothetical protein [Pseudonocardia sp.]
MLEAAEVLGRVADLPPGPDLSAALSDLYLPEVLAELWSRPPGDPAATATPG